MRIYSSSLMEKGGKELSNELIYRNKLKNFKNKWLRKKYNLNSKRKNFNSCHVFIKDSSPSTGISRKNITKEIGKAKNLLPTPPLESKTALRPNRKTKTNTKKKNLSIPHKRFSPFPSILSSKVNQSKLMTNNK